MKKVLVAINANQVNMNVLDFACFIAKLTHSKLTGVFIEDNEGKAVLAEEALYLPHEGSVEAAAAVIPFIEDNIRLFKIICENKKTNCTVHLEQNTPITDVIKENRYAKLLILDPNMSFTGKNERTPTGFIKEVLAKSECPVVIAPYAFYGIDEILFAYDGSPASVFAIKQFTYLFPELDDKKVTVLQVNENDDQPVIEKEKIGELIQLHYSSIGYNLLQ